jgi:predicted membrane protein
LVAILFSLSLLDFEFPIAFQSKIINPFCFCTLFKKKVIKKEKKRKETKQKQKQKKTQKNETKK